MTDQPSTPCDLEREARGSDSASSESLVERLVAERTKRYAAEADLSRTYRALQAAAHATGAEAGANVLDWVISGAKQAQMLAARLAASSDPSLIAEIRGYREADGWRPMSEAPQPRKASDGLVMISVRSVTSYRWLPYKKDGARQMGRAGRWQRANEYGWENADLPECGDWQPNRPKAAGTSDPGNGDIAATAPETQQDPLIPVLVASLQEVSDMFFARPDMVKAIHPLMGPAEHAICARASSALRLARGEG